MAALSSKHLVMLAIETSSSIGDEEDFNAVYDLCLKEIKKLHFIEDSILKQKGKVANHTLLNYFVEGDKSNLHNSREYYRLQWYEASDVLIFSVRDQFDQTIFLVLEQLEALLLKTLKGWNVLSELQFVTEKYGDDVNVNDLIDELNIFNALFKIRV